MKPSLSSVTLALICVIVILFSIAGIVANFVTRIELNIDGILLLLACLVMGGLFSVMLFVLAREEGWLPARKKQESPAQAAPAKQAAAPGARKGAPQEAKQLSKAGPGPAAS